jgi:hypothetical protein
MLLQYALDNFAMLVTTAECAKRLVTQERNRLAEDVIEICECVKA